MKVTTSYKTNTIIWNSMKFNMEEVRKEYLRQYPNKIRQHMVKHSNGKTYIDWRELFNSTNIFLILWKITKTQKTEM